MFSLQEYATLIHVAGLVQFGKHGIEFSEEVCREFLCSPEVTEHEKLGIAEITISKVDVQQLNNNSDSS